MLNLDPLLAPQRSKFSHEPHWRAYILVYTVVDSSPRKHLQGNIMHWGSKHRPTIVLSKDPHLDIVPVYLQNIV
jgi:hypothetical protein